MKNYIEISKRAAARFGGVQQAIKAGFFIKWTPDRIKKAFNFGRGSEIDLQHHIENNKKYCYFLEVNPYEI